MIRIVSIPGATAHIFSTIGKKGDTTYSPEGKQSITYSAQLSRGQYCIIKLATGESLADLEGDVHLVRGLDYTDSGERVADFIRYITPFDGDRFSNPMPASFSITIFLGEHLFDRLLALVQSVGLPTMDLEFNEHDGQIAYESSNIFWDNKKTCCALINGVTFTQELTTAR